MTRQPALQLLAVASTERDGGQCALEAARVAQEAVDEHLAGIAQSDAIRRLVEGADEHQAPEAVDDARRLAVSAQPVAKGRVVVAGVRAEALQAVADA